MSVSTLLQRARRLAGLSRAELARRAGTSRPTLSAYISGARTPRFDTAERILQAAGFDLELAPSIVFAEVTGRGGRSIPVPSMLPRLQPEEAFARVQLPLHLNWSTPGRWYDLSDRRQRARVYEIVLREGTAADVLRYVDGVLLVDLWAELVLPVEVRQAWAQVAGQIHEVAA